MSEEQKRYERIAEDFGEANKFEHFESVEHPLTQEMRQTLGALEDCIANNNLAIVVLAENVFMYISAREPFDMHDWGEALIRKLCKEMRGDVVRNVSFDFNDSMQLLTLDNRYSFVLRKPEARKGLLPAPMIDGWPTIENACAAGVVYGFAFGKEFLRICEKKKNKAGGEPKQATRRKKLRKRADLAKEA